MPDRDLTVYAGWESIKYRVIIDPNYGAFPGGSTDAMWFSSRVDDEPIREYLDLTRDYVESSSGNYFYVKHDLAYYGGNAPDDVSRNEAYYTLDPSLATEDTTFERAPGVYSFAGWYEVHSDGTETPYDFSRTFEGWQVRGDGSGVIYRIGDTFTLNADLSVLVSGKHSIYLDAVYMKIGTAKVKYDPNNGTINGTSATIDFGSIPDPSTLTQPVKSIVDGQAIISNLENNNSFILSDGMLLDDSDFAFKRQDDLGNSMILAGWSSEADYKPGDPFYELGGTYGVDSDEPVTLYAVWKVAVTYHLNTDSPSAVWGGDWTESGYVKNETNNTYSQEVFLNSPLAEPTYTPTDTVDNAFLYWMSDPQGMMPYVFSDMVSQNLDLYVKWGSNRVTVCAVDASSEALSEKDSDDGWTVSSIVVGAVPVELTGTSHVKVPAGLDYIYAFAAVSVDLDSVSEDNAVTKVFYNAADQQVYVTFSNDKTAPLGNRNIYFVYYRGKSISINYKSMVGTGESSGALETAALTEGNTAPTSTGVIGTYDLSDEIIQPLGWVSGSTLSYYSYAVGDLDAENAGDIPWIQFF